MSSTDLVLLRTFLFWWIVCAVVCEPSQGDIRRIIVRDRVQRSPKKSHHSHGHGHGHHGRGRNNHGPSFGHKSRGKKHKHSSEEDGSFDDMDTSFSRENSYEDKYHSYKAHKSHRQPKTPRKRPSHTSSLDYEMIRPDSSRDDYHSDWIPLSSELIPRFASHEQYRNKRKKRKDAKHRKDYMQALKPPPVELTTSYPFQFDTTSIFPQINGFVNPFSNWNYNQKLFQPITPLIGTIEQPNMQLQLEEHPDSLKNHRTSFEDVDHNLNTLINIPEDSRLVNSKEEESKTSFRIHTTERSTTTSTMKPVRSRGRGSFRGNKKQ